MSFLALARRSFWLLFGGIWAFVGTIFFAIAVVAAVGQTGWTDAAMATGIVLTKDILPADSDSSTRYTVTYRFRAPGGETVEGTDDVSVGQWESLVERGPIEVQYQPGRPGANRLTAGDDIFLVVIFGLFGLVFGGVGWVLTWRGLRGVLRARQILRDGLAAEAKVVAVEPTNVTFNRTPQVRIRYSYRDPRGVTYEGRSGYLGWDEASDVSRGDPGRIRYDPRRPTESVWLGLAERAGKPPTKHDAAPRVDPPAASSSH